MIKIIYGTDDYLLNQTLKKIIMTLTANQTTTDVISYDAETLVWDDVCYHLQAQSLFSTQKIIIIKSFELFAGKQDQASEAIFYKLMPLLINGAKYENTLIFVVKTKILRQNHQLKRFYAASEIIKTPVLSPAILTEYIKAYAQKYHLQINRSTINKLIFSSPPNLFWIMTALAKMSNYAGTIDQNAVKLLANDYDPATIFNLINDFFNYKFASAWKVYQILKTRNLSYMALIGLFTNNLMIMAKIKWAQAGNDSISAIKATLKLHPYRFEVLFQQARGWNLKIIEKLLVKFNDLDYNIKNNNIDPWWALENIFLSLMVVLTPKQSATLK